MELTRNELKPIIKTCLNQNGGGAHLSVIAKHIWDHHKAEIEKSKILYTWQYDMRWAAESMRKTGTLKPARQSPRGVWELS